MLGHSAISEAPLSAVPQDTEIVIPYVPLCLTVSAEPLLTLIVRARPRLGLTVYTSRLLTLRVRAEACDGC